MAIDNPKRAFLAGLAEIAKAVAHGHRLEILDFLAQGERCVEVLAERAGLSVANTSQHLRLMRRAGLLASRRDGKRILYRLADPAVLALVAALRRVGENSSAEVRNVITGYFQERDALEPVSRSELVRRARDGLVTVIDVRPQDEYEAGHVPGAINVPLRALAKRLREFHRGREIVAYCRGPYCVLAFEAVAMLRARGFKARRLEEGFPEWKAAGLPVESTDAA